MTLGDLLIRIGADVATWDVLKSTLSSTRSALKEFSEEAEKIGLVFDAAFTVPIKKAGELILSFGEDWHEATRQIVRGTGELGDGLAGLQDSFANVFQGVDESAGEVAETIATLNTRLGLTGEPLERMTRDLLDLAKVTGEQVGPLAESTAKLFQQWSIETDKQSESLETLLHVSQASGASIRAIQDTMQQFGPALQSLGLSFDQAAKLIGNLEHAGINVQPALAGIQKSLNTLSKAGIADPLEGLQLLADKIEHAKTEGEAFEFGAAAFGRGAATMVQAIRQGKLSFDDFEGSLKLTDASIADQAERMTTLGERFQQLKNRIETAFAPIGETLIATVEALLKEVEPLLQFITNLAGKFDELDPMIKNVVFGLAALLAAIGPLAGIVGIAALALDTLAAPIGVLLGFLGTGGGVALVAAFGVAIAGWAIYEAVTRVQSLRTEVQSLFDLLDQGVQASKKQADEIRALESAIADHNKQLGAKQINVPQFDQNDQALPPAEYLQRLKDATKGLQQFHDQTKIAADGTIDLSHAFDQTAGAVGGLDTAHKKFSSNAEAALAKLTDGSREYKQIVDQIKRLEEQLGEKSLPIQKLKLDDLQQRLYHPTAVDAEKNLSDYYDEVIKLNRAAYRQTSDETLEAFAALQQKLKLAGLDSQQAFSLLGVTSEADLNRQVELIDAALEKVVADQNATADDVSRAQIAALAKTIDAYRAMGKEIADADIQTLDKIRADWASLHLDLGQAFQQLGVTSSAQVKNTLEVIDASIAKIRSSLAAGSIAQVDADNAEIASLQKKAAAFAQIGKAMADDEVSRLSALQAQRKAAALTTDQAFNLLGLPSADDLSAELAVIQAAYDKIATATSTTAEQANRARAAELGKMISDYRAAGVQVTDDMLAEWKKRTLDAKIAALDIEQAFQTLGLVSVTDATNQITLLQAAFDRLRDDANSSAGEIQAAELALVNGTIQALQKSGQAVSDELIRRQADLQTALKAGLLNIADAFNALGVQSTESINRTLQVQEAALAKIESDEKASLFDRLQAQLNYNDASRKAAVANGEQVNEYLAAQNAIIKQRLQESLNDQQNLFIAFDKLVANVYSNIQDNLLAVADGTKSVKAAFEDMAKNVEQLLLKFVINNLLLTQSRLEQLQLALNKFLAGLFGTAGSSATGAIGSAAASGAKTATDTASQAANISAGVASGTLGLLTAIGSIGTLITSIFQSFQNARQETTLNAIELNTRQAATSLGNPGNGILAFLHDYLIPDVHNLTAAFNTWFHDAFAYSLSLFEQIRDTLVAIQVSGGLSGGGSGAPAPSSGSTPVSTAAGDLAGAISSGAATIGSNVAAASSSLTGANDALASTSRAVIDSSVSLPASLNTLGTAIDANVQGLIDTAVTINSFSEATSLSASSAASSAAQAAYLTDLATRSLATNAFATATSNAASSAAQLAFLSELANRPLAGVALTKVFGSGGFANPNQVYTPQTPTVLVPVTISGNTFLGEGGMQQLADTVMQEATSKLRIVAGSKI